MQQNWGSAANYGKRKSSRRGFSRGQMELGGVRLCLSVLRRELQFEVKIGAGKSYTHRKFSKLK